ncbi:MAG: efflux RND transporter periplasmic adaptor subunit [Balneolales bacterium]
MIKLTRKQIILIITGVLIVGAIIYGFLPGAESVETATVESSPLQVIVEEEGETYVEQHYIISSPVTAFVRRIDLDPGDVVQEGTPLVELEPPRSTILDPRSRAEAEARIEAAEASLEQADTQAEQAINERDRMERLAMAESATRQEAEQAQAEASRAIAARNTARAELAAARAAAETADELVPLTVGRVLRSPASGRVLAVHGRSERHISPGEPLLEIGDTDQLEVQVEVLSQDAVRISPGMRVVLDQWGGETPLEASVTRVERQGSVVVSALGVEERRVQVIAELISPPETWADLGSGYRVLAQFIIWEDDNVLQVPTSALFRTEEGWDVFLVEKDRAVRRTVTIGQQTGLAAQVLEGLSDGDIVIVHPNDAIEDGARVETD